MKYGCTRPIFGICYGCVSLSIYGMGIFASLLLLSNKRLFDALEAFPKMNTTLHTELGKPTIQALLISNLIFSTIMYTVTALLIAGIIKKLYKLVLPWMVMSALGILAGLGYSLYLFLSPARNVGFGILGILLVAVHCLILCVIYFLFSDLRTEYKAVATN